MSYTREKKMKNIDVHKKILGIAHIAYGSLSLILLLILNIFFQTFWPFILDEIRASGETLPVMLFQFMTDFIGLLVWFIILLIAVPSIVGGIGLVSKKSWALKTLMVPGCLSILSFPVGTVLGIYTIWVFAESNHQENVGD